MQVSSHMSGLAKETRILWLYIFPVCDVHCLFPVYLLKPAPILFLGQSSFDDVTNGTKVTCHRFSGETFDS